MSDPRSLAPDQPEFEGFGLSGEHTIYEVAAFWTRRDPYPSELGYNANEHAVDYDHMEKWVNACSKRTDFRDRTPTLRDIMNDLIRAIEGQRIFGSVVDWNGVLNPYASTVNATAAGAILARRGNPLSEPIEATTTLSSSARVSSATLNALSVLAEGSSLQAADAAFGARPREALVPSRATPGAKSCRAELLKQYDALLPKDRSTNKLAVSKIREKREAEGKSTRGCSVQTLRRALDGRN